MNIPRVNANQRRRFLMDDNFHETFRIIGRADATPGLPTGHGCGIGHRKGKALPVRCRGRVGARVTPRAGLRTVVAVASTMSLAQSDACLAVARCEGMSGPTTTPLCGNVISTVLAKQNNTCEHATAPTR